MLLQKVNGPVQAQIKAAKTEALTLSDRRMGDVSAARAYPADAAFQRNVRLRYAQSRIGCNPGKEDAISLARSKLDMDANGPFRPGFRR